jgi:hypothetical protein
LAAGCHSRVGLQRFAASVVFAFFLRDTVKETGMAMPGKGRQKQKAQAAASDSGASSQSFAGRYAFRFSGYSMGANVMPYYIVGLGIIELDGKGGLTGTQRSSITALAGSQSSLTHSEFVLTGTYAFKADGTGTANILFKSDSEQVRGGFDLVAAGADRFWMMSSGGTLLPTMTMTDEVTSGEAIKLP